MPFSLASVPFVGTPFTVRRRCFSKGYIDFCIGGCYTSWLYMMVELYLHRAFATRSDCLAEQVAEWR